MSKMILIILITTVCFLITTINTYAQEKQNTSDKEKVTFIYIHGVATPDLEEFRTDAKNLHKYFAGKTLGNYVISSDFKIVHWGGLTHQGKPGEIFKNGLIRMNTTDNHSKIKDTSDINMRLLNPIYKFFLFGDSGASNSAVAVRNFIQNYMYDIIWFTSDKNHENTVYNLIRDQINATEGKYIIVGHSFGAAISVRFLRTHVALDPDDPEYNKAYFDNCAGLITSGDLNNTVFSSILANEIETDANNLDKMNIIKFFTKNDKFWISYNHRNDIIGTGLDPLITSHNDNSPGFIIFKIKKSNYLHNFVKGFKFWDRRDGIYFAHDWILTSPKSFASSVLKAYNEAIKPK